MSRIPFPIYTPSHYTRKLYKTLPIYTPLLHTFKLCTPFTIYILLHHINKSFTQIPIHNWPLKNPLHHAGNPIVSPPYMYSLLLLGYYSLIALVVSLSNFTRSHWLHCIEEIIAGHIVVVSQKLLCSLFFNEKSLKIQKGQSESANWRRADITMSKMRKDKRTNNDLQNKEQIEHSFNYIIAETYDNIHNRLIQFTCQLYHVIVIYLIIYINRRIHRIQRSVIYGIWCSCSINNCYRCWNHHRSDVLYKVSVSMIAMNWHTGYLYFSNIC
jgi:hypothetical protein